MPAALTQHGACLGTTRIGTSLGLRQTESPQLLTASQWQQVSLLLLLAAKKIERAGSKRGMRLHSDANRDIAPRDLFNGNTVREEVSACSAILLRERQPQQPQFSH